MELATTTEMEEALLVKEEQPEDKPEEPKPQEQPQQTEIQLPQEFKVVDNNVKVESPPSSLPMKVRIFLPSTSPSAPRMYQARLPKNSLMSPSKS